MNKFKNDPKKISVYFAAENKRTHKVQPEDYYKVLTLPLTEIPGDDTLRIDSIIKWTHTAEWIMLRRSIKANDIIFIGNIAYILKPQSFINTTNFDAVVLLLSTKKVIAYKLGELNDNRKDSNG